MSGIDYGRGQTNIDRETGIRYGVIPANGDICQAWYDSAEPDYGSPHCPKCGNPAYDITEVNAELIDAMDAGSPFSHAPHECEEYACLSCRYTFGRESAFADEPCGYTLDDGEYLAGSDEVDVFVLKSPYYTRARYCSPCAPGACYLLSPDESGERAYCFGHDWFESGRAPYPVYRVSDNTLVKPESNQ